MRRQTCFAEYFKIEGFRWDSMFIFIVYMFSLLLLLDQYEESNKMVDQQ